jgi:release factor glutamine methyltransferase
VLDVGTGSGNLAIALAHAVGTCAITALELSWNALQTARANVLAHDLDYRIHLIQSDWTSGLRGPFDLIISNPPYVPTDAMAMLPREVRQEPRQGLDGGPDGMGFHRALFRDAPRLLARGGAVCVECAEPQAPALESFVRTQSWVSRVWIFDDLAGRPRGLCVQRN